MFFQPKFHAGHWCQDGGLIWNNPVQLAVGESQNIWGEQELYDLVLSVGPGYAEQAQARPAAKFILKQDDLDRLIALTSTMGGEDEWSKYIVSRHRATARSSRLNIPFTQKQEPALDAFEDVTMMQSEARNYEKWYEEQDNSAFAPTSGTSSTNLLEVIAGRLRASMYYLQPYSFEKLGQKYIFSASIRCRLGPDDKGYAELLQMTTRFKVNQHVYDTLMLSSSEPMNLDVKIEHDSHSSPIRIDADFGKPFKVSISGFPLKLKVRWKLWSTTKDSNS